MSILLFSVLIFDAFIHGGNFSWELTARVLIFFSQACVDTDSLLAIAKRLSENHKGHWAFSLYVPKLLEFLVYTLKSWSQCVSVVTSLYYFFQEHQPLCHFNYFLSQIWAYLVSLCCQLLEYFHLYVVGSLCSALICHLPHLLSSACPFPAVFWRLFSISSTLFLVCGLFLF